MEIQIRRHSCDLTRQSLNAFSRLFEEIPTFEEAFDPASLRKFFQEHESTNSQSAYSPHKDNSLLEEAHSQGTNELESLMSPSSHFLADFQTHGENKSSRYNFSFNLKLDGKGLNLTQPTQKSSSHGVMGMPFIINQVPNKRLASKVLDNQGDTKKESPFAKIGVKKQIFKIIRENKPKEVSLNVKRKQPASGGNEDAGPLKKVKSYTSSRRYSVEVGSTLKGNALKKSDSVQYGAFQNNFKNF